MANSPDLAIISLCLAQMLSSRAKCANLALTVSGMLDIMRPVHTIPL